MEITFGPHRIILGEHETRSHLEGMLQHCRHSILVGADAEYPTEFYSVKIRLGWSLDCVVIGICNEGHGVIPKLLLQPAVSTVILGFNREIIALRIPDLSTRFQIRTATIFRAFLPLEDRKVILAFDEIGVIALTENGHELWRYEKDVLQNYVIDGDTLKLSFMDAPRVVLDLSSGAIRA